MNIEEEFARALRDYLQPEGFEVTESDRIFAARVMPLVKRAQADELRKVGAIIRQYAGTELNASSAADIIDELARQVENEGERA